MKLQKKVAKFIKGVPRDQWVLAAAFVLVVGGFSYLSWVQNQKTEILSAKLDVLKNELTVTSRILEETISETHASLASELEQERAKAQNLQNQLGNVQGQVGTLSGSVNTLEKLSETDPELLAKYSKVYFLNENYTPPKLSAVDPNFLYFETRPESVHEKVWPHLRDLLLAAQDNGVPIYVYSAYRSFDEQEILKAAYSVSYGSGANKFSADQGYSEHQLGTTVDLITTGIGGSLDGFDNTQAYAWLLNNAWRYGFVLSYPKNNGFYIFEPWHWRFVGLELSNLLHSSGKNFYDMEQRDIDPYLVNIFD